ncbi:MAG: 5'-methylthioadenosine/S-adenosylhomocysteine nucleosidase [Rhodospirillaceae bacterium]|nr:5'-methylthioadenosine/S-adenosylhomocysteine nucleosidase [Rhodospirillaceae bacterium]
MLRNAIACLALAAMLAVSAPSATNAHAIRDDAPRTAVVSAFAPELTLLRKAMKGASVQSMNGVSFTTGTLEGRDVVLFLSEISGVNAAITVQLALDHFAIERVVFSGIAGGVDPRLNIGDVVIADRWAQYLEMLFARETAGGWSTWLFFEYPYPNYGLMFPALGYRSSRRRRQTRDQVLVPRGRGAAGRRASRRR